MKQGVKQQGKWYSLDKRFGGVEADGGKRRCHWKGNEVEEEG